MKRVLFHFGIIVSFIVLWTFCSFAQHNAHNKRDVDRLERLRPEIVHELDEPGSITSRIKQKTGRDKVIVRKNKITGSPHSIIAPGLEVQDKTRMKNAIANLESKAIKGEKRLRGDVLSAVQQEIDNAARTFISDNKDILLTDEPNLKLLNIQKVKSKTYVTYQQYYRDIPVYQAIIKLIITADGKVPSCGSDYHNGIDMDVVPPVDESLAFDAAKSDAQFDAIKDEAMSEGLIILPLQENDVYTYHLAYKLTVSKRNPPAYWVYFIDARTGKLLIKYNDIRYADISGRVTGLMLPKYDAEQAQTEPFRDEYVKIVSPSTRTITDADGNYSFTFNSTNVSYGTYSLNTSLEGPWCNVINDAGISASYTDVVSSPSSSNDINWATENATLAEMNVFYHLNKVHDYTKNTLEYNGMDWQLPTHVNAYVNVFSPEAVGWYVSKTIYLVNNVVNYALNLGVIYHEYTHAVTNSIYVVHLIYAGESGAIEEGLADYFACTIIEGGYVVVSGLDNSLRYPDDLRDEVHYDGEIIGGAFWDLRKSLGKELADELIHNARFGYPRTFTDYLEQLLTADDDDGDLSDGTPNGKLIVDAFTKHGIVSLDVCFSLTLPQENKYIRGTVPLEVKGDADYGFKNYELYVWPESLQEKDATNKHLLVASGIEGINYLWNTIEFKDNIYCLGLKILTEDNNFSWLYVHNVIVDNVDNRSVFKHASRYYAFPYENRRFSVTTDIDDPNGPFCTGIVTVENHNLPSNPTFDFDSLLKSWVFSWTPEESDVNKAYVITFKIIEGEHVATKTINIYVLRLIKISGSADLWQQENIAISGNYIVWQDNRNGNWDIYLYETPKGEKRITFDPKDQCFPAISGNYIVWEDYRNKNADIYLYDISKNKERRITFNPSGQLSPAISGNYIVWEDYRNGGQADIYLYDISKNEKRQITFKLGSQYCPAISGNYVVWTDYCNKNNDIYLYDISKGETRQITFGQKSQYSSVISGNYVVWEDMRNSNYGVYLYDISKNEKRRITFGLKDPPEPAIAGNYIVWQDYRNNDNLDIYLYDISKDKEWQITSDAGDQMDPAVCGNYIVWGNLFDGFSDIYMTVLP